MSAKATIEGVVRAPSLFSITRTSLPSMIATHEFVVPRSMPMTLLMRIQAPLQRTEAARRGTARVPEVRLCGPDVFSDMRQGKGRGAE